MQLDNLKQQVESLEEECSDLKGRVGILEEQFVASSDELVALKGLQDTNQKAIELLNLVSQATREKIKELFEQVVTQALQYVYQSNEYKFELDFDRQGALPKLTFLLKTPDKQEKHNILSTTAGGERDIIALALRLVLLEISNNKGFLFLDEPLKRLRTPETIIQTIAFIKEMSQKTTRQIIIIAKEKIVAETIPNAIIFNKKSSIKQEDLSTEKGKIKEEKPKKKRGRPRKVKI